MPWDDGAACGAAGCQMLAWMLPVMGCGGPRRGPRRAGRGCGQAAAWLGRRAAGGGRGRSNEPRWVGVLRRHTVAGGRGIEPRGAGRGDGAGGGDGAEMASDWARAAGRQGPRKDHDQGRRVAGAQAQQSRREGGEAHTGAGAQRICRTGILLALAWHCTPYLIHSFPSARQRSLVPPAPAIQNTKTNYPPQRLKSPFPSADAAHHRSLLSAPHHACRHLQGCRRRCRRASKKQPPARRRRHQIRLQPRPRDRAKAEQGRNLVR